MFLLHTLKDALALAALVLLIGLAVSTTEPAEPPITYYQKATHP